MRYELRRCMLVSCVLDLSARFSSAFTADTIVSFRQRLNETANISAAYGVSVENSGDHHYGAGLMNLTRWPLRPSVCRKKGR